MRNTIKILALILSLSFLGCEKEIEVGTYSCFNFDISVESSQVMDWDEIYSEDITSLVGREITLRSKLQWAVDYEAYDTIPDFSVVMPVQLLFENGDYYIDNPRWHNEGRGNLWLLSDQIDKEIDIAAKQEQYFLNGKKLSNKGTTYLIQGKIRYRDWLNLNNEKLSNPDFIQQSNKVTYWAQTFEFVAETICAAE